MATKEAGSVALLTKLNMERNAEEISRVLEAASYALNMIPNKRFHHDEYRDSYQIASMVDGLIRKLEE